MLPIPLDYYNQNTIKIANALILAGECNFTDINLIFGSNRKASVYMNKHTHMFKIVRKSYSRTVQKYVRPIFSTAKNKETPFSVLLDAMDPSGNAKKYYIEKIVKNGRIGPAEARSYRNASIAHTAILLSKNFDIKVWNRPTIREINQPVIDANGKQIKNAPPIPMNTYYSSSELKWYAEIGEDKESLEYRGSISTGTLVCDNGTYVIYALKSAPKNQVNWKFGAEERYLQQMDNIFRDVNCPEKNKKADKLMIVGKERIAMSVCEAVLSSKENVGAKLPECINTTIFVPDDASGQEIIDILAIPDYQQKFRDYYIPDVSLQLPKSRTEDGYTVDVMYDKDGNIVKDDDGDPVGEEKELLILFDNDLSRLSAALNKETRKIPKLMIYCLDSQRRLIEKIVNRYEEIEEEKEEEAREQAKKDRLRPQKKKPPKIQFTIRSESFKDLMDNIGKEE